MQEWGYLKISKLYPNETEDGRIHYVYDFYESSEKDQTLSCTVMAEGNVLSNKSKRCRVNKTDNFTIVSSLLLRSKEISLKSLGLLLRVDGLNALSIQTRNSGIGIVLKEVWLLGVNMISSVLFGLLLTRIRCTVRSMRIVLAFRSISDHFNPKSSPIRTPV